MKLKFYIFLFVLFSGYFFGNNMIYSQTGWIQQISGTTSYLEDVFFVNESTGWVVGEDGLILKTTNGGINWNAQTSGITVTLECIRFLDVTTGFAVSRSGNIIKTTNSGLNWTNYNLDSTYFLTKVLFINNFTGYVVESANKLFKTTNTGINWILLNSNPQIGGWDFNFINQSTGYLASGSNGKIWKTTDGGNTFNQSLSLISGLWAVYFVNSSTGYSGGYQFHSTTNGGNNWVQKTLPTNVIIEKIFFVNENTGFFVSENGHDSTLQKTTNGGNSWILQTKPSASYYSIFFINSNTGWAVGSGGVIIKTTTCGTIGIKKIDESIPVFFTLSQNYPNPFNPSTNIRYEIPKNGFVKLIVYNSLGEEITTLVNEKQNPGTYEVAFDASKFPSGVYFYRLETESYFETKKMILIK